MATALPVPSGVFMPVFTIGTYPTCTLKPLLSLLLFSVKEEAGIHNIWLRFAILFLHVMLHVCASWVLDTTTV